MGLVEEVGAQTKLRHRTRSFSPPQVAVGQRSSTTAATVSPETVRAFVGSFARLFMTYVLVFIHCGRSQGQAAPELTHDNST